MIVIGANDPQQISMQVDCCSPEPLYTDLITILDVYDMHLPV